MRYASTAALACGMFLMCQVERVEAQSYERVQPIVLSGSPCCASPARIASQPSMPYRGASYMSPSVSECIPPVLTASEFIPLPAGPAQPVNADAMSPIVEYRMYAPVVPPAERETVLRPPSAPTVPAGYVLGQGLIGQPKLYKPDQPVRNFLRYISL
jgi:hypothetical protein